MGKQIEIYGQTVTLRPAGEFSRTEWKYLRVCIMCNRNFKAKRRDKMTCSDTCRVNFSRERQKNASISYRKVSETLLTLVPPEKLQELKDSLKEDIDQLKVITNAHDRIKLHDTVALLDWIESLT